MKIATFRYNNERCIGVVNDTQKFVQCFELSVDEAKNGGLTIIEKLADGKPLVKLNKQKIALDQVELEAPIPHPRRNIFCVGKNYLEHVKEMARSGLTANGNSNAPEAPIIFTKVPECVIATDANILSHPDVTSELDYEAELAVIIGKEGRGITKDNAMDYVWGYTIINDVTARDLQKRHQQWHLGKSLDSFCPMGPWMVSKDELDGHNSEIKCWVNGELRQHDSTASFIFDIPTLIATISSGITLYPGDIIATGTPSGVGKGFSPPRFLKPGDEVKIEVAGIGILKNWVV